MEVTSLQMIIMGWSIQHILSLKKLLIKMNGIDVYTCSEANHATNIRNLLEYSQGYMKSQGTNEFFYIDTNRNPEERKFGIDNANHNHLTLVPNYNSGFAARKARIGMAF